LISYTLWKKKQTTEGERKEAFLCIILHLGGKKGTELSSHVFCAQKGKKKRTSPPGRRVGGSIPSLVFWRKKKKKNCFGKEGGRCCLLQLRKGARFLVLSNLPEEGVNTTRTEKKKKDVPGLSFRGERLAMQGGEGFLLTQHPDWSRRLLEGAEQKEKGGPLDSRMASRSEKRGTRFALRWDNRMGRKVPGRNCSAGEGGCGGV